MIWKKLHQHGSNDQSKNNGAIDLEATFIPEVNLKCPISEVNIKVEPSGTVKR
jgi:hypothetical protein